VSTAVTTERALICCEGLSVVHGDGEIAVHALTDVNLEIGEREHLGLLGPSGSGKTTLLHTIGGLIAPTSGSVSWRGSELSTLGRAARKGRSYRGIAYVFQGANLLPNLDAGENVTFAILAARRAGEPERPSRNGAVSLPQTPEEFLALVGLEHKAKALPAELSGGEQQRVAVARSLAQRPELLLCDEPTGHLDSDTGQRVLDLLEATRQMFGFAMVVATHDPSVGRRADRTVRLADGQLQGVDR
jgi:putative ABC transport system ATP-binding protein